jgi:hypothetical protein
MQGHNPVAVKIPGKSLPLLTDVREERTEFGFSRTRCGCESCSVSCRYIPGMLVPSDLMRLLPDTAGMSDSSGFAVQVAWAKEHLLASPGAQVGTRDTRTGQVSVTRVPTLVPARQADGMACHWLGDDGRCGVHDRSPFGCAFCDSHMSEQEGMGRTMEAIKAVANAWNDNGLYARLWSVLDAAGFVAPGPGESRKRMQEAIGTRYPQTAPPPKTFEDTQPSPMRVVMPQPIRSAGKIQCGRNDACACGSGLKYKRCHGRGS